MKSFYIGVKGIIYQDNKVLLLKRVKQGTYFWDAPGGRIDEGEEIADALRREFEEETGNGNISVGELLAVHKLPNLVEDNHALLLIFYQVKGSISEVKLSSEHEDYRWVAKEELDDFLHQEEDHINDGTRVALRKVFSQ